MSFPIEALKIEARPYADPDVVGMVEAVQAEYVVMYGGPDAAAVDPDEFTPPAGVLLVGVLDDEAVAMAGWRRLSSADVDRPVTHPTAEVKRMYVDPRLRGLGLSRAMLEALERNAAAAGVEELVLNTGPHQHAAVALYERSGYTGTVPFGHYADTGGALFFAKRVAPVDEHSEGPVRDSERAPSMTVLRTRRG